MVETMYQNLKRCMQATQEDTRSVHFLLFPEVKQEYMDPEIERIVSRMRSVIDLGRFIREQKNLPLKTPLRELVVINPDPQFHADVMSLENYIIEVLTTL